MGDSDTNVSYITLFKLSLLKRQNVVILPLMFSLLRQNRAREDSKIVAYLSRYHELSHKTLLFV